MSTVSLGPPERRKRTPAEKGVHFLLACALLAAAAYGLFGTGLVRPTRHAMSIAAGAVVVYLLIAYYVDLEPDYENLGYSLGRGHSGRLPLTGWFHVNDPFQWSDDVSRDFLFYRLLLSPGRFIAIALTDPLLPGRKRHRG
jgi:hypothetical protein